MPPIVISIDGSAPLPLTDLQEQAAATLSGSRCDAEQLERTCFSAQHCSTLGHSAPRTPIFDCDSIVAQNALGYCGSLQVSPIPGHVAFAVPSTLRDWRFLSEVCVAYAQRRGGIGRRLVQRAIDEHPGAGFALTVQAPPPRSATDSESGGRGSDAAGDVVRARYPLLLHFYGSLGFRCVEQSTDRKFSILLRAPSSVRKKIYTPLKKA